MNTETYTCKYCGTHLTDTLFCEFCQLGFSLDEVCKNQERQSQIPDEIPMLEDENEILTRNTHDLLREKTLTLYYLLKIARTAKDQAFRAHDDEKTAHLVKKIYVLENLILEREGVFPKSMRDSVLKKKRDEIIEFETFLAEKNRDRLKDFTRNS